MRVRSIKASAALLPLAVLIAGCSGLANKIDGQVDQEAEKASRLSRDVGRTAPGAVMVSKPLVTHETGIWLGKTPIKLGQPSLPPIFYEPTTFDRTINSLTELAERITLRSGIPSKVTPDALNVASGAFRTRVGLPGGAGGGPLLPLPAGLPGDTAPPGAMPAPRNGGGGAQSQAFSDVPNGVRISYSNGPLKGLLDISAARFGV